MAPADREASQHRTRAVNAVIRRALAALAWEQLWPRIVPVLTIAGLYAALSWLGLWRNVPDAARLALVAAMTAALAAALIRLVRTPMPGRAAAIRRVELRSGMAHRPVSGLDDRPSKVADDDVARALWAANQRRLLAAIRNPVAGAAQPGMVRRDPDALRFVVPVLLVVAFAVASGEHWVRLAEGFAGVTRLTEPYQARIDAWIDPPTYTRQAPVFLSRRAGDPDDPALPAVVTVPQGSRLTVRIVSREEAIVRLHQGDEEQIVEPEDAEAGAAADRAGSPPPEEFIKSYHADLNSDGSVVIGDGDDATRYAFEVTPDHPPTITRGDVIRNRTGSFSLDFDVTDDYGVREGSVVFRAQKPPDADARPLVEPPEVPMRIGRARLPEGSVRAYVRLDDHPYAGLQVFADAVVRDDAEQEGRPADDGAMLLPARPFRNPIARALIEQRQSLALDANDRFRVAQAIDSLMLYPEEFINDASIYLGLDIGYRRLVAATGDDELRDMLDYFWTMARQIEDGVLSAAEERLNAAREALEEALDRGATDEEIARLTEELRQAMNEFLQEFARQMAEGAQELPDMLPDLNGRMLSQQDLDRMLDRIEDLARLGDRDAARELLAELQAMLDNLRQAQRGQMMQGQNGEMMRQLEELGRLMREQQRLMDDTFSLNQGQRPGQRGQQGQQGQQGPLSPSELAEILRQLQQGQSDLHGGLQQLLEQLQQGMGQQGMPMPGMGDQPGQQALGRAGEAMDDAAGALGRGESGEAYGRQGDALDAMREGLEGLMQQMFGQQGDQQQAGNGQPRGQTDPLGRPQRTQGPDLGQNVRIPDEIDVERARRILNAIRERLGERFRPQFELDYLERLLSTE